MSADERLENVLSGFRREIADYEGQDAESAWSAEYLGHRMAVLLDLVEIVAELHAVRRYEGDGFTIVRCRECGWNWPCPTILVLIGPEESDGPSF